jgi:hypothetical protein
MSTVNLTCEGGNVVGGIDAILAANNDVQLIDTDGRKMNATQIMLSAGTDGTVNCRAWDDPNLQTMKFVSEGWHQGVSIGFISHTSTTGSIGILLKR